MCNSLRVYPCNAEYIANSPCMYTRCYVITSGDDDTSGKAEENASSANTACRLAAPRRPHRLPPPQPSIVSNNNSNHHNQHVAVAPAVASVASVASSDNGGGAANSRTPLATAAPTTTKPATQQELPEKRKHAASSAATASEPHAGGKKRSSCPRTPEPESESTATRKHALGIQNPEDYTPAALTLPWDAEAGDSARHGALYGRHRDVSAGLKGGSGGGSSSVGSMWADRDKDREAWPGTPTSKSPRSGLFAEVSVLFVFGGAVCLCFSIFFVV